MPTYTYKCENTECVEEEKIVSIRKGISDETVPVCTGCGNDLVRIFVKPVSFQLKGDNWFGSKHSGKKKGY